MNIANNMIRGVVVLAIGSISWGRASAKDVDTATVLAQIKQIAKEDSQSYERLLSRASPIVQQAYKDKEWSRVEKALKSAGLKPVVGDDSEYKYILLPNAVVTKAGARFDLYLRFGVSEGRSQPTYAVPPDFTITEASVGLSATPLVEQEQARKDEWFGHGSAIQEALSAWPVKDAQPNFPVLESVDISFGDVISPTAAADDHGYNLRIVLVKGKDKRQVKRQLECWASEPQKPGQPRGPIEGWLSRDEAPPGRGLDVAGDLRQLVKSREPSYQLFLYKANQIARGRFGARDWSIVAEELKNQGLKPLDESPNRYLVDERAFTTKTGQSMSLLLEINTYLETSRDAPTRKLVSQARPVLTAKVGMPFAKAISDAPFGKDMAIQKALLLPEAKTAAEKYPILDSVDINYCVIGLLDQPVSACGFYVTLDFARDKAGATGRKRVNAYIASGLDLSNFGGWSVLSKDFAPADTLGDASYGGGSEWEGGGPKTIFFLTKKGFPRWMKPDTDEPAPVLAHGVGDLKTLPSQTTAIEVKNQEIYDDDLISLIRFPNLRVLDLGDCEGITDSGLSHLAELKKLKSLTLSGAALSGTGFAHLHNLTALTDLTVYESERLTDKGIAQLAEMKSLTSLHLHWAAKLTDDQLARLAKLTELRSLQIWGSEKITDGGLKHIATLQNLEDLTFSHSHNITTAGLADLTRLKKLREISLGYMPLGDDAIQSLSQIESLEYVEIHGLEITDQGLQGLSRLARLKRLYLDGCHRVTSDGVHKLKAKLKGEFELE